MFVIINIEFDGKSVLYIHGSKDEKMSGIIARLRVCLLKTLKVFSLI